MTICYFPDIDLLSFHPISFIIDSFCLVREVAEEIFTDIKSLFKFYRNISI